MFIDAPDFFTADFGVDRIDWTPDEPASINVSAYSGRRSIAADPWHSTMKAHWELSPIVGDANIRKIRSFLRRCRGQINYFRLFADIGVQNDNADVTVSVLAHAGDRAVYLSAGTTGEFPLDGQFLTVNGQLLQAVADPAGNKIAFEPMLRQDAPVGTKVQVARPYGLFYMASSSNGYSVTGPAVYGISFDVSEAVGEPDVFETDEFDTTGERFDETDQSMDEM